MKIAYAAGYAVPAPLFFHLLNDGWPLTNRMPEIIAASDELIAEWVRSLA